MSDTAVANDEFTTFWNKVLAAKFDRFATSCSAG
jgi:hypothetical protein